MRARWIVSMIVRVLLFGTIAIVVFGQAVLHLWNWLMPSLFGLHTITYWQALGLLALSWLLFGGLRGFHGPHRGREHWRRMRQRWEQMTPEEREKFRATFRGRCGQVSPPSTQP
jgi:hypothetical protein